MDLNDIWQQHKAWILGIVGGLLVFVIANSYISQRFDTSSFESKIRKSKTALRKRYFGTTQRKSAKSDAEKLRKELDAVGARAFFEPREAFDLEGKGDPTFHYIDASAKTRRKIRQDTDDANVEFSAQQLGQPQVSPVERDEIQEYLVALDLVDDALQRLIAASFEVQERRPDARGLAAVDKIGIQFESSCSKRRNKTAVDLGRIVKVSMRFHCDPVTLQQYLENCGGADDRRPLLLAPDFVAKAGEEPGDPMEVRLSHVAIRPIREEN